MSIKNQEQRLQMIRDIYWNHSDESEFESLRNSLSELMGSEPNMEQTRRIFNLLPSAIIGRAIQWWGLDDPEVRESVQGFVKKNKDLILKTLKN